MNRKRESQPTTQPDYGFTLLELLAVIAIIGLLASIALPAISRIRERARIGAVKAQLAQIEIALQQYYTEWDTFPPMGSDWLGGSFWYSEDVGADGQGPFLRGGAVNPAYTGPDQDGTEGNYRLDPGEDTGLYPWDADDPTADNGRLDGTYYDRLGMFTMEDTGALIDEFAKGTYYHYYAGYVPWTTDLGMPDYDSYSSLADYRLNHPNFYNRFVIYSVGIDGKDHGLHNYFLVMQDGEDVGSDAYASDPMDLDSDGILFEPSAGENNDTNDAIVSGTIRETRWTTPGGGSEQALPGGNSSRLEGPKGEPVFSFDVRQERRRRGQVHAMPDGDAQAYGVIMRYGP